MSHYFIYISVIIASITLLVAIPAITFAPAIPLFLQALYTLIYRPYRETSENIRSAFNLIVMCCFVGFKVYAQYCSDLTLNSTTTYLLLLIAYASLYSVVIIGLIFEVFYYYWYNYKLPQIRA